MTKRLLVGACAAACLLGGCASDGGPGDVAGAEAASRAAPKSADQLPADMDPRARASAEAAMKQQDARTQQMQSQGDAMMRARQKMQGGG